MMMHASTVPAFKHGPHAVQVRLTSSAVPDEKDDTTVVIGPPFYLSAKFAGKELPIQVSR